MVDNWNVWSSEGHRAGRAYTRHDRLEHDILNVGCHYAFQNLLRHAVVVGVRQLHQITCCSLGDVGDAYSARKPPLVRFSAKIT